MRPQVGKNCVKDKKEEEFIHLGKLPNHWTDRDHIWHTFTYSSGNGHRLTQGAFEVGWGSHIQKYWEDAKHSAGPIVNKFGPRMQIRLHVNGHSWLKQLAPRHPEEHCGGG